MPAADAPQTTACEEVISIDLFTKGNILFMPVMMKLFIRLIQGLKGIADYCDLICK